MNIGQSYFPNLPKQGRICFPLNRGLTGSVVLSNTIGPLINGIQPGFSQEMAKLLKSHHFGKPKWRNLFFSTPVFPQSSQSRRNIVWDQGPIQFKLGRPSNWSRPEKQRRDPQWLGPKCSSLPTSKTELIGQSITVYALVWFKPIVKTYWFVCTMSQKIAL